MNFLLINHMRLIVKPNPQVETESFYFDPFWLYPLDKAVFVATDTSSLTNQG